jgi:hypothetical protein
MLWFSLASLVGFLALTACGKGGKGRSDQSEQLGARIAWEHFDLKA